MLWWRYHAQTQVARKTEKGQKANENGRESDDSTIGFFVGTQVRLRLIPLRISDFGLQIVQLRIKSTEKAFGTYYKKSEQI
jgi:GTPase involved in cell partitioning and DNA repair